MVAVALPYIAANYGEQIMDFLNAALVVFTGTLNFIAQNLQVKNTTTPHALTASLVVLCSVPKKTQHPLGNAYAHQGQN